MSSIHASTNPKPRAARLRGLSAEAIAPRDRTEEAAGRLAMLALRHWERGLAGIVTVPAAAAMTTAAGALFVLSRFERAFGFGEETLGGLGRGVGDVGRVARSVTSGAVVPVGADAAAAGGGASAPGAAGRGVERGAERGEAAANGAPATVEEAWEVVLADAGGNPIALIRALRELTGMDLRDIEALVGSVPEVVSSPPSRADAEAFASRIEAVGGRVEVRRRIGGPTGGDES